MSDRSRTCIVAGGGPAGLMAGYLLARAGVSVTVLEKHADFFRDFRGDTIHPSTMDLMAELGLLEDFLRIPHEPVQYAEVEIGNERFRLADLSHLPTRCKFIAFMPQWDFLNFIAAQAKSLDTFELLRNTEAIDLLRDGDRVAGVRARDGTAVFDLRADLVIGADGRDSHLRTAAGLTVEDLGAPMDVLWFKLPRRAGESQAVLGRVKDGQALIMLDRDDYWQCAMIIRKGTAEQVKAEGIEAFRQRVAMIVNREATDEPRSMDDVKVLTVTVDRLTRWWTPGLLFIGDAAHAMSPIGGVGINLAIQDAVAAANILADPLRRHALTTAHLEAVQRRRTFPTRATQAVQTTIQNRVIDPLLRSRTTPKVPWVLRLMQSLPFLQRFPARVIGIGFRPEHLRPGLF